VDDTHLHEVLARVRDGLRGVPGIVGLALGGSRARGTADPTSDVDVGLYYDPAHRPDFDTLYAAVTALDDRGQPDGYGRYGEWGPWIDGGVWCRTAGTKVDILLRDIDRVRRVIGDCAAGRPEIFYQVGHPHGFCTAIYVAEVNHNVPFFDPAGVLAELRTSTDPYPEPLAGALVRTFGWESGFALDTAVSAAGRGDITYVAGCAFRAIACLCQVLFAANRRYLTNEKGAVGLADSFDIRPPRFRERVTETLARLSDAPADLQAVLADLRALRDDVLARVPAGAG